MATIFLSPENTGMTTCTHSASHKNGNRTIVTTRILIDNSMDTEASCSLFDQPCGEVRADRPEEVGEALAALSSATDKGLWAAGFFSYELGYLLESRLQSLLPENRSVPLLHFALFEKRKILSSDQVDATLDQWRSGDYAISEPALSMDRAAYRERFGHTKNYIADGDIYQLNLTLKGTFQTQGCPVALYRDLRRKQPVAHGAYMEFDDLTVLSLSPELFLKAENGSVLTRPMKGTAARALTPDHDEAARQWLENDEKSRAENLMIVDLMRNDLGRVATTGSVLVTDLFTVETYRTLHQMTSGISARLKADASLPVILQSLFPPGSITGAPKVRAMEIIAELEGEARGIYTGALGLLGPDGQINLNVAIRTLILHDDGHGEIGIGSGLVDDSEADAEYEECLLKMRFVTDKPRDFDLIETLRFDAGEGYVLLDQHLDRLERSAAYFGYPMERDSVRRALEKTTAEVSSGLVRVRLLLSHDGTVSVTSFPMTPSVPDQKMQYVFSDHAVASDDVFLYHKTTIRDLYDGEYARASEQLGADEVLFVNEKGELTEGSRTNIFVERDGMLLTPPVASGLLAGTLRADLLAQGKARQAILTPDDLEGNDPVFLGNSVRGLLQAVPVRVPIRRAAGS